MNLPRKKTLREETVPVMLARTEKKHNGLSYRDFKLDVNAGTSTAAMARKFGVTEKTMSFWKLVDSEPNKSTINKGE